MMTNNVFYIRLCQQMQTAGSAVIQAEAKAMAMQHQQRNIGASYINMYVFTAISKIAIKSVLDQRRNIQITLNV